MSAVKQPELPPCCEVRRRLAERFAISARVYAEAVAALTTNTNGTEYRKLVDGAEAAQQSAEEAHAAFEEHVQSHQCLDGDPRPLAADAASAFASALRKVAGSELSAG